MHNNLKKIMPSWFFQGCQPGSIFCRASIVKVALTENVFMWIACTRPDWKGTVPLPVSKPRISTKVFTEDLRKQDWRAVRERFLSAFCFASSRIHGCSSSQGVDRMIYCTKQPSVLIRHKRSKSHATISGAECVQLNLSRGSNRCDAWKTKQIFDSKWTLQT